eukprot:CAMPEP_0172753668 /NCGR_PEP_ID=MMETSP1074-20121228/156430_1 /TAXON_ID=2916 /ORGANISM="Ceratium fusus, Strain PA161109" /LENGTH=68 /DNA_ID=CAMNT_0013586393 /DNA_START=66 /DNA_END=269 /DNA_ORIENTATION=-
MCVCLLARGTGRGNAGGRQHGLPQDQMNCANVLPALLGPPSCKSGGQLQQEEPESTASGPAAAAAAAA